MTSGRRFWSLPLCVRCSTTVRRWPSRCSASRSRPRSTRPHYCRSSASPSGGGASHGHYSRSPASCSRSSAHSRSSAGTDSGGASRRRRNARCRSRVSVALCSWPRTGLVSMRRKSSAARRLRSRATWPARPPMRSRLPSAWCRSVRCCWSPGSLRAETVKASGSSPRRLRRWLVFLPSPGSYHRSTQSGSSHSSRWSRRRSGLPLQRFWPPRWCLRSCGSFTTATCSPSTASSGSSSSATCCCSRWRLCWSRRSSA